LISQSDFDGQNDNENVDNKVYVGVFDIFIWLIWFNMHVLNVVHECFGYSCF